MKSKITIMKKPEISEEEIRSYMDFDRLLIQNQTAKDVSGNHLVAKAMFGMFAVAIGVLVGVWLLNNPKAQQPNTTKENTTSVTSMPPDSAQSKTSEPSVRKPEIIKEQPKTKEEGTPKEHETKNDADQVQNNAVEKKEESSVDISQPVYAQAEPVDGYPTLYNYFSSELEYPAAMVKDSIQGVVMVVFTINAKGEAEKISIDQSLGKAFDDEAIRLITNMPSWKPATYNKKPVPSRISLPITFQISKLKIEE
jgi:TonB family protein